LFYEPILHLLLFFSMIRPTPISTLFPYTTLFRSDYTSDLSLQTPTEAGSYLIADYIDYEKHLLNKFSHAKFVIENMLDMRKLKLDRKSTRLNSSHVSISYAVFCLKKKKRKDSKYD